LKVSEKVEKFLGITPKILKFVLISLPSWDFALKILAIGVCQFLAFKSLKASPKSTLSG
jgi:hypothetical protein